MLRLTLRSMLRQPTVSLFVVLIVTLSVAVNTALFSVFDGLMFRPLPFRDADRIVHLSAPPSRFVSLPPADVLRLEERLSDSPLFTDRIKARSGEILRGAFDESNGAFVERRIREAYVSANFFSSLGLRPRLGRPFEDSDVTSSPRAAIIGHELWRSRFGADPAIIDRVVDIPGTLTGHGWVIIGVMPPAADFPRGTNIWVPVSGQFSGYPRVPTFARLAPGVTIESARAAFPRVTLTPLRDHVRPAGAIGVGILLGAAALLLLVAWVQVAGLIFSRAVARASEIGVRLALGATSARLARLFALEGGVLIGAALFLAWLATPALTSVIVYILPAEMTAGQTLQPDVRALSFASGLSVAGFLLIAMLPLQIIRRSSPLLLLRGSSSAGAGLRVTRMRTAFFMTQLAVATVLVYLTGLASESVLRAGAVDLGFEPARLLAVRMPSMEGSTGASRDEARATLVRHRQAVQQTLELVGGLAGVERVTAATAWPFQPGGLAVRPLLSETDPTGHAIDGRVADIMLGYPAVIGVRIVEGAEPSNPPGRPSLHTVGFALANESLARSLRSHGPVIGQVVRWTPVLRFKIVGVIEDVRAERPDQPAEPTLFTYLPDGAVGSVLLVRLSAQNTIVEPAIRGVLRQTMEDSESRAIVRLEDVVWRATGVYRARAVLLAVVTLQGLLLTSIGVAGALSYATKLRTREIAIKLALGANPSDISRRVVGRALGAAALAISGGLVLATTIARVMSTYLYGVAPIDLDTIAGSAVLVGLVAWVSALVPARRAARIEPGAALREP